MADYQPGVAESSQSINNVLAHGLPPISQPLTQDPSSPYVSDIYSPLPTGCWTIPFHGNCPRCCHHHSAVQVKVKVTQDSNQVSYVHCDNCQERWAAFGGRNSTRISLLSTTTTEPDPIERQVRYSLIDVVKAVTGAAPLRTLPESSSTVPSRQPSFNVSTKAESHTSSPSQEQTSSLRQPKVTSPTEARPHHQRVVPISSPSSEHTNVTNDRSGPHRLLSKIKKNVVTRIPILQKIKKFSMVPSKHPEMSIRQFEKSPACMPPVSTSNIHVEQSQVPRPTHDSVNQVEADVVASPKRLAEVAAFIAGLDKTVLNSKNEQERIKWMREVYTEFKAGRKRSEGQLAISAIVHTSIPGEPPQSQSMTLDQLSAEVRYAGTHFEGLDLLAEAIRRASLTNSDLNADAQSASDANTVASSPRPVRQEFLERVRRGIRSHRPLSLDSSSQSAPHFRSRLRHSFDALMYSEAESTSSIHGQASSRWSASTLGDRSTYTVYETPPHETVDRPGSHEGYASDILSSTPLALSTSRDDTVMSR
jgi:hypothetical protein